MFPEMEKKEVSIKRKVQYNLEWQENLRKERRKILPKSKKKLKDLHAQKNVQIKPSTKKAKKKKVSKN